MQSVLRRSSRVSSPGQLCSRIHTTPTQQASKGSSRSRLAQTLEPKSSSGRYEVASERTEFSRSEAPHKDAHFLKKYGGKSRLPAERRSDGLASRARETSAPLPIPPIQQQQVTVKAPKLFQSTLDAVTEESEFYHPPSPVSLSPSRQTEDSALPQTTPGLPTKFHSPPLLPGFIPSLDSMLGPNARPTPIQALSIKWLIEAPHSELSTSEWKQFLLASETGSGKSLAYMLPLLQRLKLDEESNSPQTRSTERALNPRAIILAPTHELARQLSSFTKALSRHVKLRAMCASRANSPSTASSDVTAKKLAEQLDALTAGGDPFGEMNMGKDSFPVDILVGTPVKLMEMVRGRGWDRLHGRLEADEEGNLPKLRRGRDKMPGVGRWKKEPELGLKNVEWVIVDEADVLFDPDFQEVTRTLLSDISAARGHPIEMKSLDSLLPSTISTDSSTTPDPINYPFNFILTSATIPKNLVNYLDHHHPDLIRLTSPSVHQLPRNLKTEYASWTGGNKFADIEHQCRKVWASDDAVWRMVKPDSPTALSKILIFCNKSTKVVELAGYLEERGIKCVALTSTSDQRKRGSNKHLEGFLRPVQINPDHSRISSSTISLKAMTKREVREEADRGDALRDPKVTPHVMITTSLLSRGLDFAPELEHVFIVDEPRNMVDFLHRAGRSGRAGKKGKVVIFSKMKGRGSARGLKVKERVKTLMRK
ncbi:hypothetical protein AGABI2DRAFT_123286 [Agaricus bisporus var. bisporus H97]|uniref:hypothetical protein n=1 Tax=Agaricus bisporus var. bisporus (strain H97 / ATCC MYA-4626 / FGSC 10389) TaxID=936046 RepID=UPI00029F64B6|nr:hypothetical protein AGABI2DRAFT_123286 [Agaricus bisporus var. bisporus H97]EKV41807.1 hypothetical protein AGABI2DRAFT_123286 [Agaricus bisporus var. bisporus H97]